MLPQFRQRLGYTRLVPQTHRMRAALATAVTALAAVGLLGWAQVATTNDGNQEGNDALSNININIPVPRHTRVGPKDGLLSDATTGNIWNATAFRSYSGRSAEAFASALLSTSASSNVPPRRTVPAMPDQPLCCHQWAVVTTIFSPTLTLKQLRALSSSTGSGDTSWCVVVVGDRKTPNEAYQALAGASDRFVFLSADDQEALPYQLPKLLPWNHFGRKNVGYLFAVHHCGVMIYDTDDDNQLRDPENLAAIWRPMLELSSKELSPAAGGRESMKIPKPPANYTFFNPYPMFDPRAAPLPSTVWPRGFPLGLIKQHQQAPRADESRPFTALENVAVLQSLANIDPDMDALYRLTQPLPLNFMGDSVGVNDRPVVLSKEMYAPLNAQALMSRSNAFFGLLLPVSVHGRVTDIWRSYIWQRLLRDVPGGRVAFAPPWVEHHRNEHTYEGDFAAELPLYTRAGEMVRSLHALRFRPEASLPERMMDVYIACYEVGLLEADDVDIAAAWLTDLHTVGYEFPVPVPETDRPLTLWNSDLHDGTRIDVPSLMFHLGHYVVNAGTKRLGGPYPEVLRDSHMITPTRTLAPLIQANKFTFTIAEPEIRAFFDYYKDDPLMNQTNAFFCSFPMSFCEAYMPFNRSIIFHTAHRFTLGRCSPTSWQRLIDHLTMALEPRPGRPVNFVAAMGRYDQEYLRYYSGIKARLLPANALFYTQQATWTGRRPEILVGPLQRHDIPFAGSLEHVSLVAKRGPYHFSTAKKLYGHYELQQIADHRAVILFPYAVLSYGITELYAIGVPMFVPSVDFLLDLDICNTADRRMSDHPYCGAGLTPTERHPSAADIPFSPEDSSREAARYWLQLADFYQWPHVVQFDSWDDLAAKLDGADFAAIHHAMAEENVRRKKEIISDWKNVLQQIDPDPRDIPDSYDAALRDLWNVTSLMTDE